MNCFVKESYGVIWHFYYNAHGICYCKMTDENISEYKVLIEDGQEDFDVLVDDSNCIHMVFQNKDGDILYANHFNGQWRKTTLLKSKSQSCYPKNFRLKRVGNCLNVFCCIEYNGRKMLTHQIIEGLGETPQVVDCIKGDYCVAVDLCGNINLLYYSEIHKSYGTLKYVWSKKKWGDFSPLPILDNCKNPFLFSDMEDCLHIVYEKDFCVYEHVDGNEKMVGTGQRPSMVYQKENIILWEGVSDNKIYLKKSGDNAPAVIMSGSFSRPVRFGIRYTKYEGDLIGEFCPGNIINGSVRMYGINNFFVVSASPPVQSSMYPDSTSLYAEVQRLKDKVDRLTGAVENLKYKI